MELRRVVQTARNGVLSAAERFRNLETGLVVLCSVSPLLMILLDSCRDSANTSSVCAGEGGIRAAISHYWDMPASVAFYVPLTVAGLLLVVNGVLKKESEYNWILGSALLLLVVFNHEDFNPLHFTGVIVFFVGNVLVIWRAIAKNTLKIGVLAAGALFFIAGSLWDSNWSDNLAFWLEWGSLIVIATHFLLVAWTPKKVYQAPLAPKNRQSRAVAS